MSDFKRLDDLSGGGIEYGDRPGLFGGDIDELAVRRGLDSFRLGADLADLTTFRKRCRRR